MPNAKREVLIVHEWSDSYESFQPLKNLLVAAGYQTTQVFLGTYSTLVDISLQGVQGPEVIRLL